MVKASSAHPWLALNCRACGAAADQNSSYGSWHSSLLVSSIRPFEETAVAAVFHLPHGAGAAEKDAAQVRALLIHLAHLARLPVSLALGRCRVVAAQVAFESKL